MFYARSTAKSHIISGRNKHRIPHIDIPLSTRKMFDILENRMKQTLICQNVKFILSEKPQTPCQHYARLIPPLHRAATFVPPLSDHNRVRTLNGRLNPENPVSM